MNLKEYCKRRNHMNLKVGDRVRLLSGTRWSIEHIMRLPGLQDMGLRFMTEFEALLDDTSPIKVVSLKPGAVKVGTENKECSVWFSIDDVELIRPETEII